MHLNDLTGPVENERFHRKRLESERRAAEGEGDMEGRRKGGGKAVS